MGFFKELEIDSNQDLVNEVHGLHPDQMSLFTPEESAPSPEGSGGDLARLTVKDFKYFEAFLTNHRLLPFAV